MRNLLHERTGSSPGSPLRAGRTTRLGWTDPETGDRLTISIQGSESFLQELRALGFELLGEEVSVLGLDDRTDSTIRIEAHLAPEAPSPANRSA